MIQLSALVKDRPILRNGSMGDETAKSIKEAIEEQNDASKPTTFYDIDGTELTVSFLSAVKEDVKLIKGANPEYVYTLVLEVL
jgi:dihydroxyacetone kinase DhaKLM complex PTS-EIIA-like component DhaM